MLERYLGWQEQLQKNRFYKALVVFAGVYSVVLFLPLLVYLLPRENGVKIILLCLIALVIARGIVAELCYFFLKKQRPYQLYKFTPYTSWLFSNASKRGDSFPSGHTVSIASISSVLLWYFPMYGFAGILVAFLTGYARVRLGNHFFADIVGGLVIGIVCGWITVYFAAPFFAI